MTTKRITVAITGATGAPYGIELLRKIRSMSDVESHLVLSSAGALTAKSETGMGKADIEALADVCYRDRDIGAAVASGSFVADAMIIAPCSMKSLAAIASGYASTLTARAADVQLKERRTLILMVREAPLNLTHLRNMVAVTEAGGIVFPPVPAFYSKPADLDDMISQTLDRVLLLAGVDVSGRYAWPGISADR